MIHMKIIESFYDIVGVLHDRVFIIDLDLPGTKSITNNAENVYWDIQELWPNRRLIYRDTMGRWDEIKMHITRHHNGADYQLVQFIPYKEELPNL